MSIDWTAIRDGYNDRYGTGHTIKSMLESIYGKERSMSKMEGILVIEQSAIRRAMVLCGIVIQPRGHLRPTKLDRFKAIPDKELERLSNKEIAERIGSKPCNVIYYKYLKRRNYDYGDRNLQSARRKKPFVERKTTN